MLKGKKYFEGNIHRKDYADDKMTWNIYWRTNICEDPCGNIHAKRTIMYR